MTSRTPHAGSSTTDAATSAATAWAAVVLVMAVWLSWDTARSEDLHGGAVDGGRHLGALDDAAVADCIAHAWVLVLPSAHEGFSCPCRRVAEAYEVVYERVIRARGGRAA